VPALYVFGIDNSNIKGGLKDGDIIIDIKGTEARWNTLKASVNSILPGEMLELTIDRAGEIIKLEIITRERPNIPQVL
jgi:Periplasmic protease